MYVSTGEGTQEGPTEADQCRSISRPEGLAPGFRFTWLNPQLFGECDHVFCRQAGEFDK
jgi:hypothetical protein